MSFIDELEDLINAGLADPNPDVYDLLHHAVKLGREYQKIDPWVSENFDGGYNSDCECFICSRSKAYSKIWYALYSQISLLIEDYLADEVLFTVSTKTDIASSELLPSYSARHDIEISAIKPTSHPHYVRIFFHFLGKIKTEALLRNLPDNFNIIIGIQNPLGFGVFSDSQKFMEAIEELNFIDESKLVMTSAIQLISFFESLSK